MDETPRFDFRGVSQGGVALSRDGVSESEGSKHIPRGGEDIITLADFAFL